MDLQLQAANSLMDALVARHMGAARADSSEGYAVYIQEHPEAKVYFTRDQLGGLLVRFAVDGRPPKRLDYVPTATGASELADFVVAQVAGEGGRPVAGT